MPTETEVKFAIANLGDFADKLNAAGFTLLTPRAFEQNTLWDTPRRELRMRTEIVRIRAYAGRTVLTHKRLPEQGPAEDRHKHRLETETEVADAAALEAVFRAIGLSPAFRYEKFRTEWALGAGHCVVDETPIGNYAELEGPPDWIDAAASKLGVAPSEYITLSYGRLFDMWRAEHHSNAEDLTFEAIVAKAAS